MENNIKCELYQNIEGKPLVLTCRKIGKNAGGCHISLKFHEDHRGNIILIGFLPLIITTVLQFLFDVSTIFYIVSTLTLFLILHGEIYKVKSENVSLIPNIGLQYSVEYLRGFNKDTFIQWHNIDSFIINEVIERQKVIYLATVITKNDLNQSSLVALFRATKPRLQCLKEIYRELQMVLERYREHS